MWLTHTTAKQACTTSNSRVEFHLIQVVVNVPLSDKTRGMFNDETIGKMKKGAILVRVIHPAACCICFCERARSRSIAVRSSTLKALCMGLCWQVNCARGSICDPDAVVRACESGQLKGYSGDVWISPARSCVTTLVC